MKQGPSMHPIRVLFVCTGNSARSVLAEATLNALGAGRFQAFSAGSRPTGRVNPLALSVLQGHAIPTDGLSSKSWDRFTEADGPALDVVVTVCDSAASEPCPVLFGDFVRTHWGLPDPAAVEGDDATRLQAFETAFRTVSARIRAFIELPLESMPRDEWAARLDAIGTLEAEAAA